MRNMTKVKGLAFMIIPVILCVSLLAGLSLAWFTSEAKNGENIIEAGTLSLDLLKYDVTGKCYKPIGEDKLFDDDKWEPGTTKVAYLGVVNTGSLSYSYNIKLKTEEGAITLSDVLDYAIISPMNQEAGAGLRTWSGITGNEGVKTDKLPKGDAVILEGSTMVRIGSAIYGPRNYNK